MHRALGLASLVAAATAVCLSASAAQDTPTSSQDQEDKEEEALPSYAETVVVTAAGTEQRISEAPGMVTPFDRAELEGSPALALDEQLRRVPGFSLFRRSSSLFSHPTTQGFSLRGIGPSGASRSLVLWNGIPLNDPFGNWVYWNRLPTTANESVEVARGATSQLYGSSALGGTVQLFPRPARPRTLDARVQLGNRGTYDADVFTSHRGDDWSFLASARVFDTDGYTLVREDERGEVDVPAKTQFQTFLGRVEYRDFHVGVNYYDEERSNGTPAQQNESQILLVDAGYDAELWSLKFFGQRQEFKNQFSRVLPGRDREIPFGFDTFPSIGFGTSFSMYLPNGIQWGADWRYVSWDQELDDEPTATRTQNFAGAFLQYIFNFGDRVDLLVGGRGDVYQNRETKGTFNPRAGLTFRASEAATVRASVYRGFRAPSLNELYRPFRVGNVVTSANDQLVEEYLWGVEGGVDLHPTRRTLVRLNGFYNSLRDPVANVTLCTEPADAPPPCVGLPPGTVQRQRQNLGSATIAGFEIAANHRIHERFSLRGAYLFSNAVNDDTDLRLAQVPRHQGNVGVSYDGPIIISADLRAVGDAFEDDLNQEEFVLPKYAVFDMSFRVPVTPKFGFYLALENLFDQEYVVRKAPIDILGTPRMVHGGVELRLLN